MSLKKISLVGEPVTVLKKYLDYMSPDDSSFAPFFIEEFISYLYVNELISGENYMQLKKAIPSSLESDYVDYVDEEAIIDDAVFRGEVVCSDDYADLELKYNELLEEVAALREK